MEVPDSNLKARSIQLAERAYRQKARASGSEEALVLDNVGDELIRLENPYRFYDAQSALEALTKWDEERRALAYELNLADKQLRHESGVSFEVAISLLKQWSSLPIELDLPSGSEIEEQIQKATLQLELTSSLNIKRQSINVLLEINELVLRYLAKNKPQNGETIHQSVCYLRRMRDALLEQRMLHFDNHQLLKEDAEEEEDFDRLTAVRGNLAEIYANMQSGTDTVN